VIGIGVAIWYASAAAAQVEVPDVSGRSYGLARTMLAQKGLEATIIERRFSALPVDQVLTQTPVPGSILKRGDTVMLIVSAGTEETLLPDVVGDGINLARGTLESLGLVVVVDSVQSEVASDTVLGTIPAPGTVVRSGDVVRIQVSAPLTEGALLQPYDMQGITVIIDPAPLPDLTPDIALEVSRRLRSLLEASGASVTVLRGTNAADTDDATRAEQAGQTNPTVAIGVSAADTGAGGRTIVSRSDEGTTAALTALLSAEAASQLAQVAPPAVEASGSVDPVLRKVKAPWIRIGLGSFADTADKSAFSDPRWADRVARAIYAAVGEVFAPKDDL
jgi:beta-lactam-binding protein with PASTA domain